METEYSETNMKQALIIGLIFGFLCGLFICIMVAELTESSKVNAGYLTYKDKTYKVILYDTLDAPEKDDK